MPQKKPTQAEQIAELRQRLLELQEVLDGINARLDAGVQLEGRVSEIHELALEALAQAQDAVTTSSRVGDYDARLNHLTLAVAEGIQHVDRAEKRIQATVGRARRQLAEAGYDEHPGLEAEAQQLQLVDAGPGAERPVPAVREDVGDPDTPVRLPGVPGRFTQGSLSSFRRSS